MGTAAAPLLDGSDGGLWSLPEPLPLLTALRARAAESPASSRAEAPRELAAWATQHWGDRVANLGMGDEALFEAFQSCRREIWLWVTGDRRWSQLASSLTARIARRALADSGRVCHS
ncbi:MAG: hypothetical protein ACRD0Z_02915 [Acidimicrobiales bacterium]